MRPPTRSRASNIRTRLPFFVRARAAVRPQTPAPTTMTSHVCMRRHCTPRARERDEWWATCLFTFGDAHETDLLAKARLDVFVATFTQRDLDYRALLHPLPFLHEIFYHT